MVDERGVVERESSVGEHRVNLHVAPSDDLSQWLQWVSCVIPMYLHNPLSFSLWTAGRVSFTIISTDEAQFF